MTGGLPELKGVEPMPSGARPHRGGYRVFTVADLTWDQTDRYAGAFVAMPGASVSGASPHRHPDTGEFGCQASLATYTDPADYSTRQPHPLDRTWFVDYEAVRRAAYDAGLLGYMVYEDDRLSAEAVTGPGQ